MKSILVIGGAGYIGSHVVLSFLDAGFKVTVFDNLSSGRQINLFDKAKFIHGDLQDRIKLKEVFSEPYDGVVFLAGLKAAGESMIIPEKYAYQNINGAINLLEAMANSKTKIIIFSSTASVYGIPEYLPVDEEHPLAPINFYGFTKLETERFLDWFYRLKGIHFASLRYFNAAGYDVDKRVMGLEKNPANLIPIVMEAASGMREKLDVFGDDYPTKDGTGVRDYIHVSDLADAHLKAFEYVLGKRDSITVNLGTGQGCSVLEVIKMTEKITGKPVAYDVVERRPGDPAELFAHSDKADKLLNWKPKYSDLKTIISSTWEIYQESLK